MILFAKMDDLHTINPANPEQRKNQELLADHLFALPEDYDKFEMMSYFLIAADEGGPNAKDPVAYHENHFAEHMNECGTVACAVGHTPFVEGIVVPDDVSEWVNLASVCYGAGTNYNDDHLDIGNELFNFAFGAWWSRVDNTPKGAALRLYYALQHGVPHTRTRDEIRDFLNNPNNQLATHVG